MMICLIQLRCLCDISFTVHCFVLCCVLFVSCSLSFVMLCFDPLIFSFPGFAVLLLLFHVLFPYFLSFPMFSLFLFAVVVSYVCQSCVFIVYFCPPVYFFLCCCFYISFVFVFVCVSVLFFFCFLFHSVFFPLLFL